jgi:hypothetical protein
MPKNRSSSDQKKKASHRNRYSGAYAKILHIGKDITTDIGRGADVVVYLGAGGRVWIKRNEDFYNEFVRIEDYKESERLPSPRKQLPDDYRPAINLPERLRNSSKDVEMEGFLTASRLMNYAADELELYRSKS